MHLSGLGETPMRILILEDDDAFRSQLCDVLEDQGYQVVAVGRGEQAVRLAQQEPFDLVVTDIRMEGIDGLEALEQVKGHIPDVGSLVITGYSTEEDSIRAIRLGVGDYLKKPFRLSSFVASVETLLEKRRLERMLAQREQALQRTALWTVESLARSVGLSLPEGKLPPDGLVKAGQVAERLAQQVGLTREDAIDVRLATLVTTIQRVSAEACPEFLVEGLSQSVRRVLHHVGERWDTGDGEAVPLGSRVAALVATLVQEQPSAIFEHQPLSQELQTRHEGRFDPQLQDLLLRAEPPRAPGDPEAESSRNRRGLLSLGLALEEQGDWESARAAFQELLADGRISREGVAAQLGLARTGSAENVPAHAAEAFRWARHLGPAAAARTGLEAGLVLMRHQFQEGAELLRRSVSELTALGLSAEEARARLAMAHYGLSDEPLEQPLRTLFRAEFLSELTRSLDWLLPFLLERQGGQPDPVIQETLCRLVSEFPRNVHRVVLSGGLTLSARKAAVIALASGGPSAEATLKALVADPQPEIQLGASRALERLRPVDTPMLLRIYSLGGFEVYRGEERIEESEWKSQKVRYLLACLAARRGPVSEDLLIEEFWPGTLQKGKQNLYAATSYLRRHLRSEGGSNQPDYVLRTPAGLSLNPELPRWHDLDELEDLLSQNPQDRDVERVLRNERRVAELYRGPYLDGCYMDWAITARNRIEKGVLDALVRLVEMTSRLERHGETLEYGRRVLELDPCCQQAHLAVMRALMAVGRPEEAVRQFDQCRKVLAREMKMEPSIEMLEVHQRALLSIG
ncbi:MAG: response regulator [Armatimonadetes bacterium]|nr:response regulator [Armatimonadota bacterium]